MEELGIVDDQLVKEFDKLPADFWDFKNENTKELTHSIHNYPAVMVYPISRNIISIVWSYVKKKYKLNTTNFLFLCNC